MVFYKMKLLTFILIAGSILFPITSNATTCRSQHAKHEFDVLNGYPYGRKGYIVDHVCSLFNNGIDTIDNMQYQTIADAKIKDRIENTPKGKLLYCNSKNSTPTRQVYNCR